MVVAAAVAAGAIVGRKRSLRFLVQCTGTPSSCRSDFFRGPAFRPNPLINLRRAARPPEPGAVFRGAGKRAAFALFFAPLHFLLIREIVRALKASIPRRAQIVDLGCGTGPAGAAWALEAGGSTAVLGVDVNSWALEECRWNYKHLGIRGATRKADLKTFRLSTRTAVIAAFTINELDAAHRTRFRD